MRHVFPFTRLVLYSYIVIKVFNHWQLLKSSSPGALRAHPHINPLSLPPIVASRQRRRLTQSHLQSQEASIELTEGKK